MFLMVISALKLRRSRSSITMTQATSSCLEIETGNILWTSSTFTTDTGIFNSNVYNPEEKMFYVTVDTFIEGWSLSDLSNPHFSVENLHSRRRLNRHRYYLRWRQSIHRLFFEPAVSARRQFRGCDLETRTPIPDFVRRRH